MINPSLIKSKDINPDAAKRAEGYLKEITSVGSYTPSIGVKLVRESVARFLAEKDKIPEPSADNIILTEGASQGAHCLLNCMITDQNDTIMVPIPQYPLYSAAVSLYGGSLAEYNLNE